MPRCFIALTLLLLALLPGHEAWADSDPLAAPPEDRAVLILYRPSRAMARRRQLDWAVWDMELKVKGPGQLFLSTLLHVSSRNANAQAAYAQRLSLRPGEALRLELMPGEVELSTQRLEGRSSRPVEQRHQDILRLNPGEVVSIDVDAFDSEPIIAPGDMAALQRHGRTLRWTRLDLFDDQQARTLALHDGAEAIEPPLDARCEPGPRTVIWRNARLEGHLSDCRWRQARIDFDDGSQLEANFDYSAGARARATRQGRTPQHNRPAIEICTEEGSPLRRPLTGAHFFSQAVMTDGLYLYSHPCAWVVAVGDEDVTALSPEAVNALLAGELGSTLQLAAAAPVMRMAFGTHIPGPFGMAAIDWRYIEHNPAVRVVVSRDWPQRMLVPAGIGHYRNAAGEAYVGPLRLPGADGEGGLLPPRPGDGTGHLLRPDGSGILGEFRQGAAHGSGWCFDDAGATPCRHANGVRLTETGARSRPASIILAEQGNLAPALAVDFLRQRHIEALLAEDWPLWLQLDADLAALDVDTGLEALYFQAVALTALGDSELALGRVTAYLNLAGPEGAQYGSALSLLGRLREPAAAAREERLRQENAAATERRAFCAAAAEQGYTLRGCALKPVITPGTEPLPSAAGL